LVQEGQYTDALAAADQAEGVEGTFLEVWVRHSAGDLLGALELAEEALVDEPSHQGLLEQAAYLNASLYRAEESASFAARLTELGHPSGAERRAEADRLLQVDAEVRAGRSLALALILAFSVAVLSLCWWGTRASRVG